MRSCIVISRRERIMRMWGLLGGASAVRRCWLISWMHFSRIWRKSSLGTNCEGVHVCTCVEGYASTHTCCVYVREFEVSPPIGLQRSSQTTGRATNYLWSHGPMVPWSHGYMAPWSHGPVATVDPVTLPLAPHHLVTPGTTHSSTDTIKQPLQFIRTSVFPYIASCVERWLEAINE